MDTIRKIIGFSGRKQSGKDTAVSDIAVRMMMCPYAVLHETPIEVRFASQLKRICCMCFGISEEQMETEAGKQTIHAASGLTVRQLLQTVGTDMFRRLDPDCWVRAWRYRVAEIYAGSAVILVPDVRFVNEVKAIQEEGGLVIRLTRKPLADDHESETALDDYAGFDWVLDNSAMSIAQQNEAVWAYLTQPGGYLREFNPEGFGAADES